MARQLIEMVRVICVMNYLTKNSCSYRFSNISTTFKGINADSKDFENTAEKVSGKDLTQFFQQWLYQPGVPQLEISFFINKDEVAFKIEQKQKDTFQVPLEVAFIGDNKTTFKTLTLENGNHDFIFQIDHIVKEVSFDPHKNLLFHKVVFEAPTIVPLKDK